MFEKVGDARTGTSLMQSISPTLCLAAGSLTWTNPYGAVEGAYDWSIAQPDSIGLKSGEYGGRLWLTVTIPLEELSPFALIQASAGVVAGALALAARLGPRPPRPRPDHVRNDRHARRDDHDGHCGEGVREHDPTPAEVQLSLIADEDQPERDDALASSRRLDERPPFELEHEMARRRRVLLGLTR